MTTDALDHCNRLLQIYKAYLKVVSQIVIYNLVQPNADNYLTNYFQRKFIYRLDGINL